jgi:hypothetical protein
MRARAGLLLQPEQWRIITRILFRVDLQEVEIRRTERAGLPLLRVPWRTITLIPVLVRNRQDAHHHLYDPTESAPSGPMAA